MTAAARTKADRCFALARSTTFPAERETAIERGIKIAEAAGLSLDTFDIPGRAKTSAPKPPPSRFSDDLFRRPRAPEHYDADELADALRRFQEHMRATTESAAFRSFYATQAQAAQRAQDRAREQHEAIKRKVDEAQRRQRDEAAKVKAEREAKLAKIADAASNELWALGWRVYRDEDGEDGRRRWHVTNPAAETFENVNDAALCRMAGAAGVSISAIMAAQYRSVMGENWS